MEKFCWIQRLPEECLLHVLSGPHSRRVQVAAVSPAFRSAADSYAVWKHFLPSDHADIVSRAVHPVIYPSLKELYFILCDSILMDGGKKAFCLEKESGAKCYTLCARDLGIAWGDDERYWRWVFHPRSRFSEVAELRNVWWFDICGKINCRELSPNKTYKAFFIFKLTPQSYGLKYPAQQASVRLGSQISEQDVCLNPSEEDFHAHREHNVTLGGDEVIVGQIEDTVDHGTQEQASAAHNNVSDELRVPYERNDGWMEIEMGEFFNEDGDDGEVSMRLREVKVLGSKHGLIIEGIEVRTN
ncbi:F-box protein PP2-B11-like [Asparagus officinalis]|uniref:F-box protein PP2-B11-like n=1 Tax=Asparagus officinalis TaxID=4686 RepID=UPI00098DECF2|nr:F-box protein PP2-B11-like [Asparagus officinalis]